MSALRVASTSIAVSAVEIVRCARQDAWHTAVQRHCSRERVAVDVVDLRWPERLARLDDLVARRNHRDDGTCVDLDVRPAGRRADTQAARRQQVARREQPFAGLDVVRPWRHILAGPDRHQNRHRLAPARPVRPIRLLDHHDRVGAIRNRRSGGDLRAFAWRERPPCRLTREDDVDASAVSSAPRALAPSVSSARTAKPSIAARANGGTSAVGGNRLGQHPAARLGQRHAFGALDRRDGSEGERQRFTERDGVGDGTHGDRSVNCQLPTSNSQGKSSRAPSPVRKPSDLGVGSCGSGVDTSSFQFPHHVPDLRQDQLLHRQADGFLRSRQRETIVLRIVPAQARLSIAAAPICS